MADTDVDTSLLPDDVREKLAELDLELSEGERVKIYVGSCQTVGSVFQIFLRANLCPSLYFFCFCNVELFTMHFILQINCNFSHMTNASISVL